MNDFYVYAHVRKDGTPFYVGKGRGSRFLSKTRSMAWKRVVIKEYRETRVPNHIMLAENLDEQTAFDLEKFWIALFGRRGIHPGGVLVNHTDGGEGLSGMKHRPETKKKIAKKATGRKHSSDTKKVMSEKASLRVGEKNTFFGKKHSSESKKKISQNSYSSRLSTASRLDMAKKKGAKPIFLLSPDGLVVEVINKRGFCKQNQIHNAHLYELISGRRKSTKGWSLVPSNIQE